MDEMDELQGLIADLVRQPDDFETLRLLRESLAKYMAPGRALIAAMVNLLDRMLDGTVAANRDTFGLLVEASSSLEDDEEAHLALVERLDAVASGVAGEDLRGDWNAPAADAAPLNEPPLLTVRYDGTSVTPGGFSLNPEDGLADLGAALEASATKLSAQVGALTLTAGPALQRSTTELSATATDISRLASALTQLAQDSAVEGR